MPTLEEHIKQQLKGLQKRNAVIFSATVLSVNKTEKTIKVIDSYEIEYPDVRLKASLKSSDDVIKYPLKDSKVLVAMIGEEQNDLLVIAYDEVEEIEGVIGDISFKINKKEIFLNGDGFKGLMKIKETVEKINQLEDKLNSLIGKYNGHVHITTATISASAVVGQIAPTTSTDTPIAVKTKISDLENPKVKHG